MSSYFLSRTKIRTVACICRSPKYISKILLRYVIGEFYDYNDLKRESDLKIKYLNITRKIF